MVSAVHLCVMTKHETGLNCNFNQWCFYFL